MAKDTHVAAKIRRGELIVNSDEATIRAAWQETTDAIELASSFSYTLEELDRGRIKIKILPFVINSEGADFISMHLLDLPNTETFIEKVFMPFKKLELKKLCALCLARVNPQTLRAYLVVDSRAGEEKAIILRRAYDFCTNRFCEAYASANPTFAPARIMDEIYMSLADKLL